MFFYCISSKLGTLFAIKMEQMLKRTPTVVGEKKQMVIAWAYSAFIKLASEYN